MGLLSALNSLGLQTEEVEVFSKKTKEKKTEEEPAENTLSGKLIREEDFLLARNMECPCCDAKFITLAIRAGKVRAVGQDDDLRPRYEDIDPLKYDAIVCPECGYAALSKFFKSTMPVQRKKIREEVSPNFKGLESGETFYSYDEAIMRYKMVLLCDVIGLGKNSRKAYTCLKLAWVIRGKLEEEGVAMMPEDKKVLQDEELECIQKAYEGYKLAFSSESFPMCGMDEVTVSYLLAVLAFKLGEYRESMQYLNTIIGNKSISSRIKNKALDLKEKIRDQIKAEE